MRLHNDCKHKLATPANEHALRAAIESLEGELLTRETNAIICVQELRADLARVKAELKDSNDDATMVRIALRTTSMALDDMAKERDEYKRDAERYRYMRDHMTFGTIHEPMDSTVRNASPWRRWYHDTPIIRDPLDETIDTTMQEQK